MKDLYNYASQIPDDFSQLHWNDRWVPLDIISSQDS